MNQPEKKNLIVAVTGASGAIYASMLLTDLTKPDIQNQLGKVAVVFSENAKTIWEHELKNSNYKELPFEIFDNHDFYASIASGSAQYEAMIICPCSMGVLGRIAAGVSDSLITRAADVCMKERRKLILVLRETPYNLIHIKNMETLTLAGGIICPATPSFYSLPLNIEQLARTITDRILDLIGFNVKMFRWGEK